MSIRFRCPECNAEIKVSERHAGQKGKCSTCRAKILVPTLAEAAAMAAAEAPKAPTAPIEKVKPVEKAAPPTRKVTPAAEPEVQQPIPPRAPTKPSVAERLGFPAAGESPPEVDDRIRAEGVGAASRVVDHTDGVTPDDDYDEVEVDEELAPVPAPAISTREGNDVLSAVSMDMDLIHIHDDDEHDHAPPLIKKSVGMEGVEELVDMTAMVDIVFFLLIFFMMTSMQNVSASIDTPTPDPDKVAAAKAAVANGDAEADVVIRIEADNSLKFDGVPIFGEKELRSKLGVEFPGGGGTKKLSVLGHGDCQHGTVVMVLDAAHDTGIKDIKLAVADEEQ